MLVKRYAASVSEQVANKQDHLRQKTSIIHKHLQENDRHEFDCKRFDVLNIIKRYIVH